MKISNQQYCNIMLGLDTKSQPARLIAAISDDEKLMVEGFNNGVIKIKIVPMFKFSTCKNYEIKSFSKNWKYKIKYIKSFYSSFKNIAA